METNQNAIKYPVDSRRFGQGVREDKAGRYSSNKKAADAGRKSSCDALKDMGLRWYPFNVRRKRCGGSPLL